MDDLDNKLRETLGEYGKEVLAIYRKGFPSREPYISEIKQAFTDANWSPEPHSIELGATIKSGGTVYRTGQEWYDRFKKEYRALSPNAYAKDRYAKMAAEKASGINS